MFITEFLPEDFLSYLRNRRERGRGGGIETCDKKTLRDPMIKVSMETRVPK